MISLPSRCAWLRRPEISAVVTSVGDVVVGANTAAWVLEAGLPDKAATPPMIALPETTVVNQRERIVMTNLFL